jgi:hypothetical protein
MRLSDIPESYRSAVRNIHRRLYQDAEIKEKTRLSFIKKNIKHVEKYIDGLDTATKRRNYKSAVQYVLKNDVPKPAEPAPAPAPAPAPEPEPEPEAEAEVVPAKKKSRQSKWERDPELLLAKRASAYIYKLNCENNCTYFNKKHNKIRQPSDKMWDQYKLYSYEDGTYGSKLLDDTRNKHVKK